MVSGPRKSSGGHPVLLSSAGKGHFQQRQEWIRESSREGITAMIHRERVADEVYVFQSDVYAQVNAGAVISQEWAVVIDTLAFPDETLAIREFIEGELER